MSDKSTDVESTAHEGTKSAGIETPSTGRELLDCCLILVGSAASAADVERLAARHEAFGGRVLIIEVSKTSSVVEVTAPDVVQWKPPRTRNYMQWYQIGRGQWCLPEDHTLEIAETGIRVRNGARVAIAEMVGHVIRDPTPECLGQLSPVTAEARSFGIIPPIDGVVFSIITMVLFEGIFLGMCIFERDFGDATLPWWRYVVQALNYAPTCLTLCNFIATGIGDVPPLSKISIAGGVIATLFPAVLAPIRGGSLTTFALCPIATAPLVGVYAAACLWKRGVHGFIVQLSWGIPMLMLTIGCWFTFYGVAFFYVVLQNVWPTVGALFLPFSTSFVELLYVSLSCSAYKKMVFQRRHSEYSVWGDLAWVSLPIIPVCTHGFAEASRLSALIAGTVYAPDDRTWLMSCFVTFAVNLTNRLGWGRLLITRAFAGVVPGSPAKVLQLVFPTAANRIHEVAKYSMGYPRIMFPVVLAVTQLILGKGIYNAWSTGAALVVVFLLEVLEDCLIHFELLPQAPMPDEWADYAAKLDRFSPSQTLAPAELRLGTSAKSIRQPNKESVGPDRGGKPRMHTAMRLWHLREWPRVSSFGMVWIVNLFSYQLFELLLGPGYILGLCSEATNRLVGLWRPVPLEC